MKSNLLITWLQEGSRDKRSAINRTRKLRKNGMNIPPPFPNGWYALLSSSELKPGTATDVNCLGENFVVFRSAVTKKVFVLDAYCPHMGANMGVGGIVREECIVCPFHGKHINHCFYFSFLPPLKLYSRQWI